MKNLVLIIFLVFVASISLANSSSTNSSCTSNVTCGVDTDDLASCSASPSTFLEFYVATERGTCGADGSGLFKFCKSEALYHPTANDLKPAWKQTSAKYICCDKSGYAFTTTDAAEAAAVCAGI